MATPQNLGVLDESFRFTTGLEISPRLSFRSELHRAIAARYPAEHGQPESFGKTATPVPKQFEGIEFFSLPQFPTEQTRKRFKKWQADLRQRKNAGGST